MLLKNITGTLSNFEIKEEEGSEWHLIEINFCVFN